MNVDAGSRSVHRTKANERQACKRIEGTIQVFTEEYIDKPTDRFLPRLAGSDR